MSDQRDWLEIALRSVYGDRKAHPTDDLRARIDEVPVRVSPGWSPVRRAFVATAGLGAAAAAAAAVLTAVRNLPRLLWPSTTVGSTTPFDPLHPGGGLVALSGVTIDGLKLALTSLVVALLIGTVVWVTLERLRGRESRHPRPPQSRRQRLIGIGQFALVLTIFFAAQKLFEDEPLEAGSTRGPGIGFSERRMDGVSEFDLIGTSARRLYGDSYLFATGGPRDIYVVAPGEPLTYFVSVRNAWPIGIRLDGRWVDSTAETDVTDPSGSTATGLGLLRDPTRLEASIANTIPFTPVDLAPGEEVRIVVAEVGRACADPTRTVPLRTDKRMPRAPRIDFVIEILGVQRVASILLSPEITVPSSCD